MSERVRLSYEVTMVRLEVCREKTMVRLKKGYAMEYSISWRGRGNGLLTCVVRE